MSRPEAAAAGCGMNMTACGAQTYESQNRAGEDIADEVLAAFYGDELRWRVVYNSVQ